MNIVNQLVYKNPSKDIEVWMKREDLIHPFVSGNKFRKLKYNIQQAQTENKSTLLTFGGAFSNHIAAVAFAGKMHNLKTIGVIRGDELESKVKENPTLKFAQENGMEFHFVSREIYREKEDLKFIQTLQNKFGDFYLIPEGGTNALAVKGCQEILTNEDAVYSHIATAVGTGGTISGLINTSLSHQKILGFPALKGDFLRDAIRIFASNENWELVTTYHFGGYGKITPDLISFINKFSKEHKFLLDPIYTAKMIYGIFDLIDLNYFADGSKILAIHTGGIQGIAGINQFLEKKNLEIINTDV